MLAVRSWCACSRSQRRQDGGEIDRCLRRATVHDQQPAANGDMVVGRSHRTQHSHQVASDAQSHFCLQHGRAQQTQAAVQRFNAERAANAVAPLSAGGTAPHRHGASISLPLIPSHINPERLYALIAPPDDKAVSSPTEARPARPAYDVCSAYITSMEPVTQTPSPELVVLLWMEATVPFVSIRPPGRGKPLSDHPNNGWYS